MIGHVRADRLAAPLSSRIAKNVAELIANLNASKSAIELYGPSIVKMQKTWARNQRKIQRMKGSWRG